MRLGRGARRPAPSAGRGGRFRKPDIELVRWFCTLRIRGARPDDFVGGRVPRRARPAIRRLNRLIDSSSERDPDYEPR